MLRTFLARFLSGFFIFLVAASLPACGLVDPESKSTNSTDRYLSGGTGNSSGGGTLPVQQVLFSKLTGSAGTGLEKVGKKGKPSLQAPVTGEVQEFALGVVEVRALDGTLLISGVTDDAGKFSLEVPSGKNYFLKVTNVDETAFVRGYISSISGTEMSNVVINSLSSSLVYALEEYLEIPDDVLLGYTGSANIRSIMEQLSVHSKLNGLSALVQEDIFLGNAAGLSQGTLDFLAANFTNTPPTVQLLVPETGTSFSECEIVKFQATGQDSEDGNLFDTSLVWSSSISGSFGHGEFLTTSILTPGVHTISVTAHDIGAKETVSFVSVTILPVTGGWCSASSGGLHSLAIKGDETLWGWGLFGSLNDGTTVFVDAPIQIGSDNDWRSVSINNNRSFAIKMDGSLWSWGQGNNYSFIPSPVDSASDWGSVSTGLWHQVGRKYDGSLWAWGTNGSGQLGNGTTQSETAPVKIGTSRDWQEVSAGHRHTVALKTDGSIWAWGSNAHGQLGDGFTFSRRFPVKVGGDNDWVSVSTSGNHNIALKSDGTIWGWGDDLFCQLGVGCVGQRNFPIKIGEDSDWAAVFAGPSDSFAIKEDGTLWGWGNNNTGKLGDVKGFSISGSTLIISPGQIGSDTDWSRVYTGMNHTIAMKKDGTMVFWGRNQNPDSDVIRKL
ncbi:MAG: RCC1 domain-containing protein [Nitrospinota bacterium]